VSASETWRMGIATSAAMQSLLRRIPHASREAASNEAEAIAMGILHGCCGPNGDFSSDYKAPAREVET